MASVIQEHDNNSQGGKDLSRAHWSKEAVHSFCDVCNEFALKSKGKRGTTSIRIPWKVVESEFQKRTKLSYDKTKLKSKYDWMRSRWSLWKQLKGRETGLGWDVTAGTISADDSWWTLKIKENEKFGSFRSEGIEPELEYKMDQLFGSVATGIKKHLPVADIPSQCTQPHGSQSTQPEVQTSVPLPTPLYGQYDNVGENINIQDGQQSSFMQDVFGDCENISPSFNHMDQNVPISGGTSGTKRPAHNDISQSSKSTKLNFGSTSKKGAVNAILQRLDFVTQLAVEKKNEKNEMAEDILNTVTMLCSLPDLEVGSPLFSFACSLIKKPEDRAVFQGIPTDHGKVQWIKFMFDERMNYLNKMNDQITPNIISFQNDDDSSDEDDDEFWDMITCISTTIGVYFINHVYKEPCMTSYFTGEIWMNELLNGHDKRCYNMFRMNQLTFRQLCHDLESKYGLKASSRMSTFEKVGIFVYILSKGASNRDDQERFQHSGETISRVFKEVLDVMDGFSRDLLRPRDPEFKEVHPKIANDTRYMPHFKECIDDGTHIAVIVPEELQMPYRGRKGITTTNVLAACDFDLLFTYVLSGWEGSAHDSRIFLDTIGNSSLNFPKPPPGKYYLADKGYPEREGYLTPYPKTRYHQSEFRAANPRGSREIFNQAHSSLRSCIERDFGVLKARWKILDKMPLYSLRNQNRVICAGFAFHNYIRLSMIDDLAFSCMDRNPDHIPCNVFQGQQEESQQVGEEEIRNREMSTIRDNIASSLMAARRRRS